MVPGKSIPRACLQCGETFLANVSNVKRGGGLYCTFRCSVEHHRRPAEERFWALVWRTDGCWLWLGGTSGPNHYGAFRVSVPERRQVLAHRFSWELLHGPVPEGQEVCHTCDTPRCVRPDHLFLGTRLENMADMKQKGRNARGSQRPGSRLTEEQVREIRRLHAAGETGEALALRYDVCTSTLSRIVRRKLWQHV